MEKTQNMIKCIGAICWLITACSKYDANRLNMVGDKNEDKARADSDREPEHVQPCNGCKSLHDATQNGHENCVKAYIGTGADVNARYGKKNIQY